MSFSQSGWEVKLHLSALKAGRRFQRCLSRLPNWPLQWAGGSRQESSDATQWPLQLSRVQPSLLSVVWEPHGGGKKMEGEKRDRMVSVFSVQQGGWGVESSRSIPLSLSLSAWDMMGVCGPVLSLSSWFSSQSSLSRYLCHTEETNIETPSTWTKLKALLNKKPALPRVQYK